MVHTYRAKTYPIEAILFEYSDAGIEELKGFCGNKLLSYGKDRTFGAKGWAIINTYQFNELNVKEGFYIYRNSIGDLFVEEKCVFESAYERIV